MGIVHEVQLARLALLCFQGPNAAKSLVSLPASHPAASAGMVLAPQEVLRYPWSSAAGRHAVAPTLGVALCTLPRPAPLIVCVRVQHGARPQGQAIGRFGARASARSV